MLEIRQIEINGHMTEEVVTPPQFPFQIRKGGRWFLYGNVMADSRYWYVVWDPSYAIEIEKYTWPAKAAKEALHKYKTISAKHRKESTELWRKALDWMKDDRKKSKKSVDL
jgi:hypothetical protein